MALYGCDKTVICTKCGKKLFVIKEYSLNNVTIGSCFIKCSTCGKEVFNPYVKEFECLSKKEQEKLIPYIQKVSKKDGKKFLMMALI